MQWYSAVVLLVLVAVVSADEFYTTKFDDININDILNNKRLYTKYRDCTLEDGPTTGCPPEALELKKVLVEAIESLCAKCSPLQQQKAKEVLDFICKNYPEDFTKILKKLDPDNKYRGPFEEKFGKLNCDH